MHEKLNGRIKKWVLTVLVTVVLGAVGSGLWETALGPSLRWSRDRILDVASFGFHSYKHDIYLDIAKRVPSFASVETLAVLMCFLSFGIGSLTGSLWKGICDLREKRDLLQDQIDAMKNAETRVGESAVDEELKALMRQIQQTMRIVYVFIIVVPFFSAYLIVRWARTNYIDSASQHYEQVLRIASPYLDEPSRFRSESRFAQIRSKEDYVAVVNELAKAATEHSQYVPDFNAW